MAKKQAVKSKKVQSKSKPPQSVFQEAWSNMMEDMDRFLPGKLKGGEGKKKFVLWLFILELVVLGVIGKLVYGWIRG